MQIEKAYLFARQISAGEVPPPLGEDVYFEKGIFNPLYVPQGFDFDNNKYEMKLKRYGSDGIADGVTYPSGRLTDGTNFRIKTSYNSISAITPNNDFQIVNGNIQFHHVPAVPRVTNPWENYLLLPIVNVDTEKYKYIVVDFIVSNTPTSSGAIDLALAVYTVSSPTTIVDKDRGSYADLDLNDPSLHSLYGQLDDTISLFHFRNYVPEFASYPPELLEFWVDITKIYLISE